MKHILDADFRYRPSFDTDVRKTFEKARRQQQVREREPGEREAAEREPTNGQPRVKVLKLEQLKKASAS